MYIYPGFLSTCIFRQKVLLYKSTIKQKTTTTKNKQTKQKTGEQQQQYQITKCARESKQKRKKG